MAARCNECGNPVDFYGMLCEVCNPADGRDIAKLGREEHDFRESRRKAKRDARRGSKKQQAAKKTGREHRSGHLRGAELDDAARKSVASSDLTEERT